MGELHRSLNLKEKKARQEKRIQIRKIQVIQSPKMRQQPPLLKTQRRQAVKVLQRKLRLPLRIKEEQKIANHQTKIRTINQERKVRELKKMMRRSRRHLV